MLILIATISEEMYIYLELGFMEQDMPITRSLSLRDQLGAESEFIECIE